MSPKQLKLLANLGAFIFAAVLMILSVIMAMFTMVLFWFAIATIVGTLGLIGVIDSYNGMEKAIWVWVNPFVLLSEWTGVEPGKLGIWALGLYFNTGMSLLTILYFCREKNEETLEHKMDLEQIEEFIFEYPSYAFLIFPSLIILCLVVRTATFVFNL